MEITILKQPESAIAQVQLDAGEEIIAEAGAMISMSANFQTNTTLRKGKGGGMLGGLKRSLAGESLFLSQFRALGSPGEIFLAPQILGDIFHYSMGSNGLVVQAKSYLASSTGVEVELGFQGFKSLFSGENMFWLDVGGMGELLLNSFGAIYEVPVNGEYIVDTGHIVAFEKSLNFDVMKPPGSSWLSAWLGGEGLVCRFKGVGRLFCQTHNAEAFGRLVGGQLPPRQSNA
ncbi:TIGR00266 family protein [Phormidium sp. CCY1219]|uniref:TIGR00266 family protein n=1 Tax=Phormidium sp. CCY1219 TaxID=2886104 RepID=UPI002D1F6A5C|nr:TIGR00266 family protein [Phormidium sp. CCY1219]MEB3829272.1 TIGR00266 family protein [Phormidium sp. CCY1219]